MPVAIKGSGGGSVTLDAGAAATDTTLTLPNTTGTVALTSSQSFANATFTGTTTFPGSTTVDSSGNVGIGVTAPSAKLQVKAQNEVLRLQSDTVSSALYQTLYNSAGTRRMYQGYAGASTSDYTLNNEEAGAVIILTSATERMRIDSSGNVGIGTSSPASKLNVVGGFVQFQNTASVSEYVQKWANFSGVTSGLYTDSDAFPMIGSITNHPFKFMTNATERARIDSSGNILVNTTTDWSSGKFVVSANSTTTNAIVAQDSSTTYNDGVYFQTFVDSVGNLAGAITHTASNAIGLRSQGDLRLYSSGTERARIDTSGNFLVGTTTTNPGNASNVKGFGIENSTGSTFCSRNGDSALFVNRVDTTGSVISMKSATTIVGTISVTSSATAYNTSSDYRLKNSVQPMTAALATVTALKPVTYKWNVDGSDGEGFIAHELQEIIPHAVSGIKDAVDEDGKPVHQGVDYSKIVVHLVAAIQELKADLDAAKAEIATLKGAA
jgi:hypothetical protein